MCGCAETDRDPQNIWDPRKNCRSIFRSTLHRRNLRRPTLVFSITSSFIAFPLTPKHVTLNDIEWPFALNSVRLGLKLVVNVFGEL